MSRASALKSKTKEFLKDKNYAQAERLWQDFINDNPADAQAQYEMALVLMAQGKLEAAYEFLKKSIQIEPGPENFTAMGKTLRFLQVFDKAQLALEKAVSLDEKYADSWAEMATLYFVQSKMEHAILLMNKAIALSPKEESAKYQEIMSEFFRSYAPPVFSKDYKKIILEGLRTPNITHSHYATAWAALLMKDPSFGPTFIALTALPFKLFQMNIGQPALIAAMNDPFFYEGVKNMLVQNIQIEAFLQKLRRHLLEQILKGAFNEKFRPILFALSHQCFLNEYVMQQDEEEKKNIEILMAENDYSEEKLAILSCYRPLHTLENAKEIKGAGDLAEIIKVQITEPLEEETIKPGIKTIGRIENEISGKVRAQYEENPYPRWKNYANATGQEKGAIFSDFNYKNILIAGCGTGQQIAITRLSFPGVPITAIDITQASLAYAMRKCREYKFSDVEFYQADILDLEKLDRKFDLIKCTGVLHHMEDPVAGWRVLTNMLNPGGYMHIGLYSEAARQRVIKAREIIARENFPATPEGIRACREYIKALPPENIAGNIMRNPDFYSLSACRDFIFHVQEHRFTLPQIANTLKDLGLTFERMIFLKLPVLQAYQKAFPEDKGFSDLEKLAEFENKNPDTFIGMYQFWVRKAP